MIPEIIKGVTPRMIQDDLANLIACYQIVGGELGQQIEGLPTGVLGTAGGWAPKPYT